MEVNKVYLFVDIYKEKKEKDFRMIILPSGRSKIGLIRTKDYGIISYLAKGKEKKNRRACIMGIGTK